MDKSTANSRREDFDVTHAYFIGPNGSNMPEFRANINTILDELLTARQSYYPDDQLSVPFWSPRYEAYMYTDLTMPSLLGYFMTMLYNPNNLSPEVSPVTTMVELEKLPLSWGHITCGGTVANLESAWVARNLKFYPLSFCLALRKGKLNFIADRFCTTFDDKLPTRLFKDLHGWDLLNLHSETILGLPEDLNRQFGISHQFVSEAVNEFSVESIGREVLEKEFGINNPVKYFISKTGHYCWPKIAGIGSRNVVGVDVNNNAQIDTQQLEHYLKKCAETKTAVFAVVVIIGSTEEGAVDRLTEVLRLRKKLREEHGLSFLIHANAAWGGYFSTMLSRDKPKNDGEQAFTKPKPEDYLNPETVEDLRSLAQVDSITVDPHKAGYIPYPAGSLAYRDGRIRHLISWSGPYLSQGADDVDMGMYGVEGSKPGAAAMSVWLSNQAIGLNPNGYGKLLGEAAFTSARLSAHYATMVNDDFICVPFNMLPAEKNGDRNFLSAPVAMERQKIRELITHQNDEEIFASEEAMGIIRDLGSNTNINCFTLNWKDKKGNLNTNLEEANDLMKRVVDRLSISSTKVDPSNIAIHLASTQFSHKDYGTCAHKFMERMGIEKTDKSLFVIRNVVTSPFPTGKDLIASLMMSLHTVIREEVEVCRKRNAVEKKKALFLVQGTPRTGEIFLILQPSFHDAAIRRQIILSAKLDDELARFYQVLVGTSHKTVVMVESLEGLLMENVVHEIGSSPPRNVSVVMYERGLRNCVEIKGKATLKSVVKSRSLDPSYHDLEYPGKHVPFYLYGSGEELHISHILLKSPNIALAASHVEFRPNFLKMEQYGPVIDLLSEGLILGLMDVPEASIHPVAAMKDGTVRNSFFQPRKIFKVRIWKDPNSVVAQGPGLLENLGRHIYDGEMMLKDNIFVDFNNLNEVVMKEDLSNMDLLRNRLVEVKKILGSTNGP
ncbi:L-tyrosine decarboxylase [Fusarium sp. NRRL 52700]|nr:L-tyrosine decarboxylase [Fusarium sp. NRRL 52700]